MFLIYSDPLYLRSVITVFSPSFLNCISHFLTFFDLFSQFLARYLMDSHFTYFHLLLFNFQHISPPDPPLPCSKPFFALCNPFPDPQNTLLMDSNSPSVPAGRNHHDVTETKLSRCYGGYGVYINTSTDARFSTLFPRDGEQQLA